MAEYGMQEMNLPNEEGRRVLFPRLIISECVDTAYLAGRMSQNSTFSRAEVIGLIESLTEQLAFELSEGRSVKIDGLGTFTPALVLREGKERESGEEHDPKRNAQSIEIGKINFRANKSFIRNTSRQCTLRRSERKFKRSSQKYSPEQRRDLAQKYLDQHPFMRVSDYAAITGLRPTTASLELKKWAAQSNSCIKASGRGSHRVYVKREV